MRPSGTTDTGSALRAGADPRSAWLGSLSTRQIDSIFAVIRTFGLDFYDAKGRPDRERLDALFPPGPRQRRRAVPNRTRRHESVGARGHVKWLCRNSWNW